MQESAEITAAMNVWTEAMTTDRTQHMLYEVGQWFGRTPEEVGALLSVRRPEGGVWDWTHWARFEWLYGWPPAVADTAKELGIDSVLDFGAGIGEVGLHLHSWGNILVQFVDLPGPAREFITWRIGRRLSSRLPRPLSPEELFALPETEQWDAVLCLEVLEHIADAPDVLRRLLKRARKAFCITGELGRPPTDKDPLHIYRENLCPVLEEEGWKQRSGGGKPH